MGDPDGERGDDKVKGNHLCTDPGEATQGSTNKRNNFIAIIEKSVEEKGPPNGVFFCFSYNNYFIKSYQMRISFSLRGQAGLFLGGSKASGAAARRPALRTQGSALGAGWEGLSGSAGC